MFILPVFLVFFSFFFFFTTRNDGMCFGGVASLFIWNVPFSCFWNATSQFPRLKASYHHSYVLLKEKKKKKKKQKKEKKKKKKWIYVQKVREKENEKRRDRKDEVLTEKPWAPLRPSVRLSVPHKASSPTRVLLLLGLPQHQDVLNSFVVAFTVDFCRLFINIFPHNGTLLVLRIPPLLLLLSDPRPLNFFPDIILMIYMCIDFLSGNKFHSREIYCAKPSPTGLPLPYNPPGFPSLSLSLSFDAITRPGLLFAGYPSSCTVVNDPGE